ncbi:PREDICTED: putative pentatricopeptide repeat-containing protein At3g23330 [Lupinus angustifolius]|uniref:putative pentatricopeptide repeat-containing protein At3g23330 n=1 Tax=Lupinus angustifolius TaxID=3871 RepID=UPI00092EAEC3|nr:PREDICTED: putative pentatricopeptide repeat-containing protein At3g23330 [Lupinus angustifolius]
MECSAGTSVVSSFQTLLLPISQVQTFSFQLPRILFYNSKSPLISVPFKSSSATTQLCHPTSISTHEKSLMINKTVPSGKKHGSVPQREDIEEEHSNVDTKLRLKHHSSLLGDCALRESLNEGMAIHGHRIKNGVDQDTHFWISLINFYAKCGCHSYARQVLDEMPEQDVVSWTALIQGFVGQGNGTDGIALFCEMRKKGIRPNEFTVTTCLKACSMCLDMNFGKQVHAEAIKLSLLSDVFVGSALVNLYAKCGEMDLADKVFFCMPEQNEVLWNVLINGHAQVGDGKGAFRLFCHMLKSEVKFSKFTLPSVLKSCANSGDLRDGQAVHGLVFKSGCELDKFLCSSLIDMYSKCDLVGDALKLFLMITDHDVVSWSAMITCLDQQGHSQEAAKLFYSMRHTSVKPNQFTFSSVVSAATELGDLLYGQSIHACIFKHGFKLDISVSNALIRMYMKHGCVHDGARVFEALTRPDIVSWNNLLSGFHDYGSCESGPKTFYQMLVEGFRPNMYTFISVLRSCSSLLDIVFGKQVHAQIVKNNLDGNEYVRTALVDMYAKCRCMEESYKAFARLISRDVFTWTVMITGYAQTDQAENAIKFFNLMQQEGVKPNEFTVAGCLSGCSQLTVTESGLQLHSMAIKSGLLPDMYVSSALVDMYAKCGCIEDAETIFKGSVRQDAVVWNTMICGFSMHGWGDKALQTFQSMKDEGNLPDEVTFIGVLSACSHMGLIEEGKQHFNSMSNVYGMIPRDEHFACMVDILSRAGRFDEVESFVEEMKLTSNPSIWEIILGACAKHGNAKFGEKAARKLFELNHETDSTYILLSNIFASKGRWTDVKRVRAMMSSKGVKKEPGCSWVEINNKVHVFVSDGVHPNILEIHLKLEELGQKLSLVGYVPQTEHVLHNIPDKEKKEHLNHHSEKLALAFALISSQMKRIRIFKNLRICLDCHNFMKLVSDITNREIIVRDINRFHHFKGGSCSCHDYW